MHKKLSPFSSHNNQKGWAQLLCEEMGDNFLCIHSIWPKPCSDYMAWTHCYKCRSSINVAHFGPERASQSEFGSERVSQSELGPERASHSEIGPTNQKLGQKAAGPNLAQNDVTLYRSQSDWASWPKMTSLYIGANQIGPASRTNQSAPNLTTIRLC